MAKLFIIGNGFDSAHKLKTSYNHFREYLLSNNPEINMEELIIPEEIHDKDGGITYNQTEVLSMLFYLINEAESNTEEWSSVESSLGYLDFSEAFDWLDDIRDKDGDINYFHTSYRNDEIASKLVIPTTTIQQLFSDWVNTININLAKPKKDFQKIVDAQDYFLTFNYTDTLQDVYGIEEDNICHIHGRQFLEIFFGHGNSRDRTEDYMRDHIGSEDGLSKINRQLRKKVEKALENNLDFFDELQGASIEEIYSYGFSFNKVDRIYLEEICNRINTENITWYFNDYKAKEEHPKFKDVLRECGYRGFFSTFHVADE
ncbi:bacteriophage abortive infection AbiH family protein [Priestia megaterium]|uniref:bacteriophage abortive infection AbiH family protein n=1 Tax=Priestia megaterium TaxID=1404 RepID=UPI0039E17705